MYTNFGQYQTVLKHFWHNEFIEIIQIFRKFQHYYELGKASAALWTVFMHTWGSTYRQKSTISCLYRIYTDKKIEPFYSIRTFNADRLSELNRKTMKTAFLKKV